MSFELIRGGESDMAYRPGFTDHLLKSVGVTPGFPLEEAREEESGSWEDEYDIPEHVAKAARARCHRENHPAFGGRTSTDTPTESSQLDPFTWF